MGGRLPDGVVTFLFTDVEGSTKLWEDAPDRSTRPYEILVKELVDRDAETSRNVEV